MSTASEESQKPTPLAIAIARAAEIRTKIEELETELEPLEEIIAQAGVNGPHIPLEDAEREGKQAILRTPTHTLHVQIQSDNLVGGFDIGSEMEKTIRGLITSTQFDALFKVVKKHERKESDGHKFRMKAKKAIPDQSVYLQVIKALRSLDKDGIPKSKTVIAWNTLETLTPAES